VGKPSSKQSRVTREESRRLGNKLGRRSYTTGEIYVKVIAYFSQVFIATTKHLLQVTL
jgi:hypothetical protein